MNIISEPVHQKLYFQQNIPDIVISKNTADTYVIFELWHDNAIILRERYDYDADGNIRIRNIYEIIEKWFDSAPEILMPGTTNTTTGLAIVFAYTLTEVSSVAPYHTVYFWALKCDAEMTADAATWTAENFLTRRYRDKRTAKSRNEYLSFLMKASYSTVTINYKVIYLLDGVRTEIIGTLGTIAQQTDYKVATINASIYRIMTAAGLVNFTTVIQYDIWLTGTGLDTNVYTFLVDNQPYRHTTSFVFINCFGCLESFTATGITETQKAMEYNFANIDGHYRKLTQDFYSERQCITGYLYEEEMDWLDDFIRSFSIIRYSQDITQNEEVTLISVDKTDSNANELQSFTFNYRKAKNIHLAFANAAKNISQFTFNQTFA